MAKLRGRQICWKVKGYLIELMGNVETQAWKMTGIGVAPDPASGHTTHLYWLNLAEHSGEATSNINTIPISMAPANVTVTTTRMALLAMLLL